MRLCGILFQEVRDALKIMYDWGNRPCRSRLGYGSKFFINIGGPQAMRLL